MNIDKKKKRLLIGIIITIIIILIMILILNSIKDKEDINNMSNTEIEELQKEEENKELIRKLKKVSESERIRIYLGTYFRHIENKEYEEAYNLLYQEFKNNYFPTIEEFQKYMQEQEYPDMLAIEYEDIEMQGEYYIVNVNITDFLPNSNKELKSITLIVKENDYNNYYISFTK